MKIVEINGGLGNQMCQYVFARFLEINFGYDIMYDTLYFDYVKMHNGFELDKLFKNAKVDLIKNSFDADVWGHIRDISVKSKGVTKLPNLLFSNGMEIAIVADEYWHRSNIGFGNGYDFDGSVYKVNSNQMLDLDYNVYPKISQHDHAYFMGAWLGGDFFEPVKEKMVDEFEFPELQDQSNIDYKNDILSKEISVGLHVRRGDFIPINKAYQPAVYAKAIKDLKFSFIREGKPKAAFYIFSDDIAWCKENIDKLGLKDDDYVVFIEGNDVDARHYIDMQLMTFCDYLIHNISSSFCKGAKFASKKDIIRITC